MLVDQRDLELQHAGEQVLFAYQRLVDAKDLNGLARLVTDDVLLERRGVEHLGREPFLDLYRRFASSDVQVALHTAGNVEVREIGTDADDVRLRVDSAFLALTTHATGEARLMWGRYRDDVVHRDGRWALAAKRISLVRTAVVAPDALVSPDADSFGPLTHT